MLKLYDYFRSSACFRVRIALQLKKLDYETVPIHLINNGGEQSSEFYQKINPEQLVPAIQDENHTLTQSIAIIEYLDEVYPDPPLLPHTPFEKASVRAFALAIAADIHPLNNLRVLNYLKKELNITDDKKNTWYQHWIAKGLSALEKQLTFSKQSGYFCFGNSPTLADICLIPQLYNAKRFSCDLTPYPILMKIDSYCQTQQAFINAMPKETVS